MLALSSVLQAAERHNFVVVEDDIFQDMQVKSTPRLATLDQPSVIRVRSFPKTLSGSLRVGSLLADWKSLERAAVRSKMLTSITTAPYRAPVYLMLCRWSLLINICRGCTTDKVKRALNASSRLNASTKMNVESVMMFIW